MSSIQTQGTKIYFKDIVSSSVAALVELACPTAFTGLGGSRDQIEDTCLSDIEKTFTPGLGTPDAISIPFILQSPAPVAQQLLFDLRDLGTTLDWIVCLADGTNLPTLDISEEIVPPTARTSAMFEGYIANVAIDIATNEVVRGTITVQRSGGVTWTWLE
ncbi:MAG: phage tail tube protein [Gammaproteobacteria bacterium]